MEKEKARLVLDPKNKGRGIHVQTPSQAGINNIVLLIILIFMATFFSPSDALAQGNNHYMRIAKIVVNLAQLENYKAALKEGIHTAVEKEPGVLSLFAVYDKAEPTHVTVFEIYADENAYQSHIKTAHFIKYKETVKDMVKSLELVDVEPIGLESKPHL